MHALGHARNRAHAALAALLFATLAAPAYGADRTVAVTGEGEVRAPPDRATVALGIEAREPQLDAARSAVNRGVEKVLALARDLDIDADRVDATRVSIRPEYDWDPQQRQRRFLGYFVSRQVTIDLEDLDRLGVLIERAIDLGVNQVGDPQLDSSRRRDLEREALAQAVEDARRSAEVLAKAAGASVGAVRSLASTAATIAPPMHGSMMMEARMASDAGAPESYVTGDMRFTATVQAEYDLVVATR